MRLYFAADHAGYQLKEALKHWANRQQHDIIDLGTYSEEPTDYPDNTVPLVKAMKETPDSFGILVCGSGIGMAIAANRYKGIRAFVCHDLAEARRARIHNNANVICFGARFIDATIAGDCLSVFLESAFEGGRHERRVQKLDDLKT